MALITCKECGKEISDKAEFCPHCGNPEIKEIIIEEIIDDKEIKKQEQESDVISMDIKQKPKKKKSFKKLIFSLIIIIIIGSVFFCYKVYSDKQKQEKAEYMETLLEIKRIMNESGKTSEDICYLVSRVWKNAIYQDLDPETDPYIIKDFNFIGDSSKYPKSYYTFFEFSQAVDNVYKDYKIKSKTQRIEIHKNLAKKYVQVLEKLNNKRYNDILIETYLSFDSLTDFALNPEGNFEGYKKSLENKLSSFLENYRKLDLLVSSEESKK